MSSPAPTRLRNIHWSTWLVAVLLLVAAPRLLPHVAALLNVTDGEARRPTFEVSTLEGDTIRLSDLRGRVVLVNIWATWCIPCRLEMPMLESTWARHRDAGLVLIGASVDQGDPSLVRAFVHDRGVTYPIAIVGGNVIAELGGVTAYPTSVLIGRDGVIRHRVVGPVGPLTLEPAIRRALVEQSPTPDR